MSFRNAFGIYQVLERLLKASPQPRTCVQLFDSPDVKKYVDDANRVSDYLGHMYRRGLLSRVAAEKTPTSMARWAYSWKDPKLGSPVARAVAPRLQLVAEKAAAFAAPQGKPVFSVAEVGDTVTIELENFILTIKSKQQ